MNPLSRTALIAALGLAGTAMAAQTGMAGHTSPDLRCFIATTTQQGMLTLEGTVLSPTALEGSYRFTLRSPSANINQAGTFSAQPDQPALLGRMAINAGANYEATLELETGGQRIACTDEIIRL